MRLAGCPEAPHILILDDYQALVKMIQRVLLRAGYRVSGAVNFSEALSVVERVPVDLLLADVVMPQLQPDQLLRALRAVRPRLPVLFMSGYPRSHPALPISAHWISKPFKNQALLDRLQFILGDRQVQTGTAVIHPVSVVAWRPWLRPRLSLY